MAKAHVVVKQHGPVEQECAPWSLHPRQSESTRAAHEKEPTVVLSKCCTNVLINILRGGHSIKEELDGHQGRQFLSQIKRFLNWIPKMFMNSRIKVILIKGSILDGLDEGLGSLQFFKGCDNMISSASCRGWSCCAILSGLPSGGGD